MRTKLKINRQSAITRTSVAVIMVGVSLLGAVFVMGLIRARPRVLMIDCNGNLKLIGIAYRVWESDHGDKFPMAALTNANGNRLYTNAGDLFEYYKVMSNEISNPKALVCPADKAHRWPTNFGNDFKGNANVSYFVGYDASSEFPQRFLSGDNNITNGTMLKHGEFDLSSNSATGWTVGLHYPGGNIGMADGSVQQLGRPELNMAVARTGLATNRLLMPVY